MKTISVIQSRKDGTPLTQRITSDDQLDDTLKAFFNIGATKITVNYHYGNTEYAVVPEPQ